MKLRLLLILLTISMAVGIRAQPTETNYLGTLIASGPLNPIPLASDGPFPIGFNFTFYGNTYNQFWISENGRIMFTEPASSYSTPATISSTALPNNFIAPFWDNLTIDGTGNILYTTIGVSPSRKLIVQYRNMMFWSPATFMGTFSVILFETSNIIQVQYRQIVDKSSAKAHGATATIGIENIDGTSGALHAFQSSTAITAEQAISFTPGTPYIINSTTAIYDDVFLVSNETLPEPGITNLISPPQDGTIGADHTFQWGAATNASSYSLLISTDPGLGGAVPINAGSNLSYNVTGLTLDETYYWGVFATNATGTTWCEIKRFTTSSTPPLAAVPQTVWVEKSKEKLITLHYTGGDANPKTAIITSLPPQGDLFQYNGGSKGDPITSVPTSLTDPGMNLFFGAKATPGNGIGNFNFKINDSGGDSPEATVTVNVTPAAAPNVLYIAKSSTVEIQFDRIMADPAGKHGQFGVTIDGTPAAMTSAALKPADHYTIVLSFTPALTGTETTVLVSYTQGDIVTSFGGVLISFTDQPVTLRSQTITFDQSLDKKYSDSPVTFTATAPGGSMTYSSSNLSIATIAGSVATLKAIGSIDVTARQAGNATYAPAKYIKTMTVAKGDQTITFGALTAKVYGDTDFNLTAVAGSGLQVSYVSSNTAVATVAGNTVSIVGAGSTTITASQAGNTLWNAATDVPQNLTVNKGTGTVTLGSLTATYNGVAQPATATTSPSGMTVDFTYDGSSTIPVNAGSYAVVGTINNTNYQGTSSGTLIIGKAAITAIVEDKSKNYGEANPSLNISYTGFVNSETSTVIDAAPTAATTADATTSVGTVPITVSGGTDNNYTFFSYTDGTLTINKATLTVTADDKTRVYGGANPALTITYSGFVNSENSSVIDIAPTAATIADANTNAGTVPITVSGGSDNNYSLSYISGTLTITKAAATITPGSLSVIYNGMPQPATATTIPTGLTVDFTYDGSATIPVNAGAYTVVATINNTNYQGTSSGTLNIGKATLTATADNKSKAYGEANPSLTISYTGFVNSETSSVIDAAPTAATTADATTGVGTVPITVSGGSDNNYTFSYSGGTLTINKATLTATADDKTRVYGDANPSLTITYSGFVNSETSSVIDIAPIAATTADASTNSGTVPITVSGGSDNNYTISYIIGTITITKAEASITLGSAPAIYDGLPHAATATTIPTGFSVDFTYDGSSAIPVNAGAYAVVATINNTNYQGTASGTLNIGKASLTAIADDKFRTYGEANPSLTISYTGFVNSETSSVIDAAPAVATTADASTGVGTVPITVSGGTDNNYTFSYTDGTLTVNKATLTVTADDKTRVYGEANPALTITYSGFVNSETSSVIDIAPTAATTAIAGTNAGTVPISVSGGSDNNYSYSYISGTLTITQKSQEITITDVPEKLLVGDSYTLGATSSSGLSVSFESDDELKASVSGNTITGVSDGKVQIRAFHLGDINYLPAEAFGEVEIYSTHKDIMNLFTPNNDGINDYWELPDLVTWGKCDVRVFSRSGKLIFSDPDYNNRWDGTLNGAPLPEGAYYYVIKTENAGSMKGTVNIVR